VNRILILTLLASAAALAQDKGASNPFSTDARGSYTQIKQTLLRAAEKMPEENYSFRTVKEVKTYGEMLGHVADIQMALCGLAKGERKGPVAAGKTSKADVTTALKASFDYCDTVYNSMNDADGAVKVSMFGQQMTKLGVLNFNTMHDNEMYGTMVAFLRLKGIVPPSSEGRP
jgi:hypothetical protein